MGNLKDGYYLSTYLHIDPLAHVTETSVRHDQNISLWKKEGEDIILITYWELERITGKKQHAQSFYCLDDAKEFINQLLARHHLCLDDMEEVWGTPGLEKQYPSSVREEYEAFTFHCLGHLFSALLMDSQIFYEETIICMAIDAGPDYVVKNDNSKYHYCGSISKAGKIIDMFPIASPGIIWELARNFFGIREGTLMALANASTSEIYDFDFHRPVLIYDENSSDEQVSKYFYSLVTAVNSLQEEDAGVRFSGFDTRFSKRDNQISMVMKEIQKQTNDIMEYNLNQMLAKYQLEPKKVYLAMAGGSVLNCPTNSNLMRKYDFKGFLAPPCVNDTGLSLGIALYSFYHSMNRICFSLKNAYYGECDESLDEVIQSEEFKSFIKKVDNLSLNRIIEDLQSEPIIWFNGASEIGPRSLGNRSILGNPVDSKTKEILNTIKQRQWWRPVAPIILEDDVCEWFEDAFPTHYMLHTFHIRRSKRDLVPSILHLDGTARVQTMSHVDNPDLYAVLQEWKRQTGIPIICNTSLNDRGEPIINTIKEALNFTLRKKIRIAYINCQRVELQQHEDYVFKTPYKRQEFVKANPADVNKYNPDNLKPEEIGLYYSSGTINRMIDLDNSTDRRALSKIAKKIRKKNALFQSLKEDVFNEENP